MNTVFMVMPILNLLMFQLGLDFEALRKVASKPGGLVVGFVGQIVVLPIVAWILVRLFWTSSPPSLPHKEDITMPAK